MRPPRHLIATILLPSTLAVVLRETNGRYRCAVVIFCSGDCLRAFQRRCRQSILDSRSKRFNVEVCISHGASLFRESFLDRVSWVPFQRSRSAARHERLPRQAASSLTADPVMGNFGRIKRSLLAGTCAVPTTITQAKRAHREISRSTFRPRSRLHRGLKS